MAALDPVELLTPRLLLRPLLEHDAAALLEIHADPRVMEFSNSAPWRSLGQAEELVEASRGWSSLGTAVCLGMVPKNATSLVGTCTLFDISRSSRRAEVGFVLGSSAWGRGYMTEALKAFLCYGFGRACVTRALNPVKPGAGHQPPRPMMFAARARTHVNTTRIRSGKRLFAAAFSQHHGTGGSGTDFAQAQMARPHRRRLRARRGRFRQLGAGFERRRVSSVREEKDGTPKHCNAGGGGGQESEQGVGTVAQVQ
jgi:ribosomal-protein-alanine N-acetyltransferase